MREPYFYSSDFHRMNKAPVQGYEKDVGSRTTHRIMLPRKCHASGQQHTPGAVALQNTRYPVGHQCSIRRIYQTGHMFGFGANSKGTWHHYFKNTPKSFKRTGKHSGGIENETILELQERRLINLYMGW
ncbi:CMP-N-acetylneuraminate-beta-galactosamide-alpha-2,3-sialyltransferase 1 [Puntigrus tetrazona]|uniref:CMP-N-acetylneuraminate-beta-galactosamide- alpha-2,3-sialyltransferase 1 n=1 Tax=Puntigrus tetrazona TaxID=1606681 RepID=UPI001C8907E8|nr:CMP-N-acetylneuraminate-beta-galactosamide-alpha-2,3-sialyltransferase 1 [Puntigrus tetrazona]